MQSSPPRQYCYLHFTGDKSGVQAKTRVTVPVSDPSITGKTQLCLRFLAQVQERAHEPGSLENQILTAILPLTSWVTLGKTPCLWGPEIPPELNESEVSVTGTCLSASWVWLTQCGHHRPRALGEPSSQSWNRCWPRCRPSQLCLPNLFPRHLSSSSLLSHPYTYSAPSWGKCLHPSALSHTFENIHVYDAEFNSVPRVTLSQVNCYIFPWRFGY